MKLRLGPLPDVSSSKMTITIPSTLRADLEKYASIHSKLFGTTVDAHILVPLMLAVFLAQDKVFQRALRQANTH